MFILDFFPRRADGPVHRLGLQPARGLFRKFLFRDGEHGRRALRDELGAIHCSLFFLIWPGRCMLSGWWWPCSRLESNTRPDGPTSKTPHSTPSKGFMAVSCFTLVPVELYKLSVTLQASLTAGITGYGEGFDVLSTDIITSLQEVDIGTAAASGVFGGSAASPAPSWSFSLSL